MLTATGHAGRTVCPKLIAYKERIRDGPSLSVPRSAKAMTCGPDIRRSMSSRPFGYARADRTNSKRGERGPQGPRMPPDPPSRCPQNHQAIDQNHH